MGECMQVVCKYYGILCKGLVDFGIGGGLGCPGTDPLTDTEGRLYTHV